MFNRTASLIFATTAMVGCGVHTPVKPGDPAFAPVLEAPKRTEPAASGSLFMQGGGLELFVDRKAHRVGDVITIVLSERTVSQKTTNISLTKDHDVSFNAGPLLGNNPVVKGSTLETEIQQEREFTGEADADQSNSLQGNITVTVADILPNGNLMVRGEKWMTLNRGDEFIRISGILRPEDITPENTVPSNRLANARIAYSGTGDLADTNNMGWLARFFNSPVWPF
ncbi:flagellar basal body L-ring protein FlgH [Pseudomaricurvus alkylphenolicus]|jgi:flagellar L-ring protein precursor FlgH|uniref:flagellar basal body L-ring protein FlgH n=1 Tax=Pseudomaricurvus alkylphenolicus TaxID=1306991 RepID=UPI00141EEAA5|nr:flagellar basal body L-ring protein FlgH [Pseudomaricurvus alkylphenolicus]NIB43254.1 flagellar basal body L-ring protein FlgH [Pseudomaricurvus alkylphenolicus]